MSQKASTTSDSNTSATPPTAAPPPSSSATTSSSLGPDDDDDDFGFFYDYAKAAENRSEAWTEENWESEMEKHPLFISQNPEPNSEQSALVEAIAQLKYDPEFNSPAELMDSYRVDGNENFKNKKYRWAIDSYSEGAKIARRELSKKGPEAEKISLEDKAKIIKMVSTLYNNRASAHFYLENYRSSSKDARLAMSLDPTNQKAILRVPNCLFKLRKYQEVIDYCQGIVDPKGKNATQRLKPDEKTKAELRTLLKTSTLELKKAQRDDRKKNLVTDKRDVVRKALEEAVRARSIQYRGSLFETEHGSVAHGHYVHFEPDSGTTTVETPLVWPVIFVYPEYGQTDFIQSFHEGTTFRDLFATLFASTPEWDTKGQYTADRLRVWFHSFEDERYSGLILKEVKVDLALGQALKMEGYVVTNAIPVFVVALEKPKM